MPKCPICDVMNPSGTVACQSCGGPIPQAKEATGDLEQQVRALLGQGRKIEAVKLYRDATGRGLKASKEAVEAFQQGDGPLPRPGLNDNQHPEADRDLEASLLGLLKEGKAIQATKKYHDRTGASLMESKNVVESLAKRHGIETRGGGCGGTILALLLAVASVALLVLAGLQRAAW